MVLSSTYQSTGLPLLSTLYEPPPKHLISVLGAVRFASYERSLTDADRTLDVMFDDDGTVWMAGIPRKGDLNRLASLLHQDGHRAWTSQALAHVKVPAL